nr:hypothetical protein [uncultured Draconibacterium sp.]
MRRRQVDNIAWLPGQISLGRFNFDAVKDVLAANKKHVTHSGKGGCKVVWFLQAAGGV